MANGVSVHWLTGSDLTEAIWDAFFAFYMETGSRKWGRPYLTRAFYSLVGETMGDKIALVMAKRAGRFHAQLLIESHERPPLHQFLDGWLPEVEAHKSAQRVHWALDVDPLELF